MPRTYEYRDEKQFEREFARDLTGLVEEAVLGTSRDALVAVAEEAIEISPRVSGHYAASFQTAVGQADGRELPDDQPSYRVPSRSELEADLLRLDRLGEEAFVGNTAPHAGPVEARHHPVERALDRVDGRSDQIADRAIRRVDR